MRRFLSIIALVGAAVLAVLATSRADSNPSPLNDLLALGQAGGQTPAAMPIVSRAEPPLQATPLIPCDVGSRPEPGVDGRVPAGSATNGMTCNTSLVSHQGTSGGFKVFRYTDDQGHVCAYYDTALLFPINALKLSGTSLGVAVLDMTDPTHPVQTDTLTTLPMLSPHESLNVNQKRGLIAAVLGNPATAPGLVSIYDAHNDCRHPVLQSTKLVARFGHESGFSPDGKTFYAAGTAVQAITAIDVTDPKNPHAIWQGNEISHGLSLSDDGNRAYVADIRGNLLILDTSQIQARQPHPQAKEIARLTWASTSIPQNAIPFTENGHPYLLEFDEYNAGVRGGDTNAVGAARIIDISNEAAPFVVSNLRLQVNQPAEHKAADGDPGAFSPVQGYGAHYCNIPARTDPKIVACSFITSGLRLFDISNLTAPKELGYFVAPTKPRAENGFLASDFAMSMPAFDVARHDVWYADGGTGFYVVHVADDVWPAPSAAARKACTSRRRFLVRLPRGAKVLGAKVAGKRTKVVRRGGVNYAVVDLRGRRRGAVRLVVRVRRHGRTRTVRHTYHPCTVARRKAARRKR